MDTPKPLYRVGMLLSGCGLLDGSDPTQAVLIQVGLDEADAELIACAPDQDQHDVVHPLRAEPLPSRNALAEAARPVRGLCVPLDAGLAGRLDALVVPGGLGVLKTLWGVAHAGLEAPVEAAAAGLISALHQAGKPIAAIDEGVVLLAGALRQARLELAGGTASPLLDTLRALDHDVRELGENQLCWDAKNRTLTAMTTRDLDVRAVAGTTQNVLNRLLAELDSIHGE
ncbi:MAG: hypothetical protein HKO53_08430 [Gemmatimonadetes bacterium]|nr:hypothetical protein [Gemmatimonadota bacterium]